LRSPVLTLLFLAFLVSACTSATDERLGSKASIAKPPSIQNPALQDPDGQGASIPALKTSVKSGQVPVQNLKKSIFAHAPVKLLGLSNIEITKLLGVPHFQRIDDPGALWQYRTQRCILNIFFHAKDALYLVTHTELNARGNQGSTRQCDEQPKHQKVLDAG
jgi:hypothetical protein